MDDLLDQRERETAVAQQVACAPGRTQMVGSPLAAVGFRWQIVQQSCQLDHCAVGALSLCNAVGQTGDSQDMVEVMRCVAADVEGAGSFG
jgi:hypothetical protein